MNNLEIQWIKGDDRYHPLELAKILALVIAFRSGSRFRSARTEILIFDLNLLLLHKSTKLTFFSIFLQILQTPLTEARQKKVEFFFELAQNNIYRVEDLDELIIFGIHDQLMN